MGYGGAREERLIALRVAKELSNFWKINLDPGKNTHLILSPGMVF